MPSTHKLEHLLKLNSFLEPKLIEMLHCILCIWLRKLLLLLILITVRFFFPALLVPARDCAGSCGGSSSGLTVLAGSDLSRRFCWVLRFLDAAASATFLLPALCVAGFLAIIFYVFFVVGLGITSLFVRLA